MMQIRGALAAVAALLAGCTVGYTAPSDGPITTMRVTNDSAGIMVIQIYGEASRCRNRRTVMSGIRPGESRDIPVPAGGDLSIRLISDISAVSSAQACHGNFTFPVEADEVYAVQFVQRAGACKATILEADKNVQPANYRRTPFRMRVYNDLVLDESGPFCEPET